MNFLRLLWKNWDNIFKVEVNIPGQHKINKISSKEQCIFVQQKKIPIIEMLEQCI